MMVVKETTCLLGDLARVKATVIELLLKVYRRCGFSHRRRKEEECSRTGIVLMVAVVKG